MRRKRRIFQHSNTQGYPLREHIDLHHPLVELADMIDWASIDRVATEPFPPGPGRRQEYELPKTHVVNFLVAFPMC